MENKEMYSKGYLSFLEEMKKHPDLLFDEYRCIVEHPERLFQIYHVDITNDGTGTIIHNYVDENGNPCTWGPKAVALNVTTFENNN